MADTERRHEWADPDYGLELWIDEGEWCSNQEDVDLDAFELGQVETAYVEWLAAKCDTLEAERGHYELDSRRMARKIERADGAIATLRAQLAEATKHSARAPESTYRKGGA